MNIKGKDIKLRYKNRALYQWEVAMNKRFEINTQYDEDVFLYCLIITNNDDIDITFLEFSDWLEEHPEARTEFIEFLERTQVKNAELAVEDKEGKEKKS